MEIVVGKDSNKVFNACEGTKAAGAVFKGYMVVPYTSCLNTED